LKKLCFAILTNYLDLLQIVSRSTLTPSSDSGSTTLREQKLYEIELLFINIHHLINELRPHQARETLRVILEEQKQQREKTSEKLYSFLNRIVDVLNSAVYSLNDLVPKVSN
jgi:mediator of RNA polymerase II transcription subunit 7